MVRYAKANLTYCVIYCMEHLNASTTTFIIRLSYYLAQKPKDEFQIRCT